MSESIGVTVYANQERISSKNRMNITSCEGRYVSNME